MEIKKTPKADLESKKSTFFLIGLCIALLIMLGIFSWKSYEKREVTFEQRAVVQEAEDMVDITKQEQPKEQPPAPKPQVTQIQVVEDDVEVDDELEIDADVKQDEIIEEFVYEAPEIEEEVIEEAEVFTVVEEMPSFPGGPAKMTEYIAKNIKYPVMARESGVEGRVFVNFVVEPNGSISKVKVLRGIGGGCDEEAMRVVQSMPAWKPGKQRGTAVRVNYTVPIIFKLQ